MKRIPLLVGLTIAPALIASSAAAVQIAETHLSDVKVERPVAGIPITFPGQIDLGAEFNLRSPSLIKIHAVVDLGDLQRKLPAIVSTMKLPSDNCGSFSANNKIVTLSNTRLDFDAGHARVHVEGSVAVWDCRENPVPNSKVEWQMKKIGFIKTKVPVLHTWPGSPIKDKLGTQPFSMDVPFGVAAADGGHARIVPGEASLHLDGKYAGITRAILAAFKVDLDAKLNEAIAKALDPKVATAAIPKEYLDAGLTLNEASFVAVAKSGDLGLDVRGSVKPSIGLARQVARILMRQMEGRK